MRFAGAARWFIAGVVALALLGTAATLLFSFELSAFIARAPFANLWLAVLGSLIKAGTLFGQEWLASHAAARVKEQLRTSLLQRVFKANRAWHEQQSTSALTALLTTGLDSLDAYFSKFLPQVVYTALAIPIYLLVTFNQDALSGVVMLSTMPLIPLFMIVIGWATQRVQQRQLDAMLSLSTYFGEIIRGLLTLRVFNRSKQAADNLVVMSKSHRKQTMKVLSVSFLSGFALELIASLSVALIAVSIGLRLLNGQIDYRAGLFVLLLAPDAYLPLRMIGANFHASTDGVAAIAKSLDLLEGTFEQPLAAELGVKSGKLNVVTGESGVGKSTALEALDRGGSAWMPQTATLLPGTVRQNIAGFHGVDASLLRRATALASLEDVSLDLELSELNQALSGGQAQRVALARAIYRALASGAQTLLLDEPLSAQDSATARRIVKNLKLLCREGITVVAVSHQDALTKVADNRIELRR